ncbi:MAG: MazF family transcriptional regulator [Bacteroidales bacterium 36-12]|nr:MAG: MazF family transcriptional regulator [Bacteroidales bacterium 36-12]
MEISIVKIGNSRGFRLSKTLLEKYQIKDKVELILEKSHIIIKPVVEPRKGWDLKFKNMHEHGDDELVIGDVFDDENMEDWQ